MKHFQKLTHNQKNKKWKCENKEILTHINKFEMLKYISQNIKLVFLLVKSKQ